MANTPLPSAQPLVSAAPERESRSQWDWTSILGSPAMLPVILALTFVVFAPSLNDWFVADDFLFLRASRETSFGSYVLDAFDYRTSAPVPEFTFYRPLYVVTFRLCYEAFGLHAWAYHALNIILHLVSVTLLWLIARRLTRSGIAANAAAFIFALHPVYTETIWWISRGNTIMTTVVYLGTLLMFMKHLDGGRRAWLWYACSVIGFTLAILYHTTALTLVAVLPAYAFLVAWSPARAFTPQAWVRFIPFVLLGICMALIQTSSDVALDSAFKLGTHQIDRYRAYLGFAAFPLLPEDWQHYDLGSTEALRDVYRGAAIVMLGIMAFVTVSSRKPYVGIFAALWLVMLIAPNSTAILGHPVTGAIPAQLYLPGTALALVFVCATQALLRMMPGARRPQALGVLYVAAALLIIGAASLNARHQRQFDDGSIATERFIRALRADVGDVTPGSRIYVVNPPEALVIFNDNELIAAISVYYPKAEIQRASPNDVPSLRASMSAGDHLFVYRP